MKNNYWIKRYNKYTTEIKHAVCNINNDMLNLSAYCDKLENVIEQLVEFIVFTMKEDVIHEYFGMTVEELKKWFIKGLGVNNGTKR